MDRQFDRRFVALIVPYILCTAAYTSLNKFLHAPVAVLLPSTLVSAVLWACVLAATGWWRRLGADWSVALASLGGAAILLSSTVVYSLPNVSIVLPELLSKLGVLVQAPLLDAAVPDPRSLVVLLLAVAAVALGVAGKVHLDATAAALVCVLVYVIGYGMKLRQLGRRRGDFGFFVSCTTGTLGLALLGALVVQAATGVTPLWDWRAGLVGLPSQGLGFFGGMLLMLPDQTHSRLVPLHRSSSLIGGVLGTVLLAWAKLGSLAAMAAEASDWKVLSRGELVGVALMVCALWVGSRTVRRS